MVPGKHVRPTADRVKESLFSVIGPFFDGGWVLDLFAGTGALGLEALSRGAERAIFVDLSKASCDIVRANVEAARMKEKTQIIRRDARSALKAFSERQLQFDLIFLDPPYFENLLFPVMESISKHGLLAEEGILIAEHAGKDSLPESVGSLVRFRELKYGDTKIALYERSEGEEGGTKR